MAAVPSSAARVVLLVTAAVFINYVDRGNIATAAPLMLGELHLTDFQYGRLYSAFYYTYVPCMLLTGWLADRFGAKVVLAGGIAIWSIATLATGIVGGFAGLLLMRLLLGVGESVAFPCASQILARAVAVGRLGVANGVMSFGYLVGPAVGTFIGGMLMSRFGWRLVFVAFGAASLLWLLPWRSVVIGPPATAATAVTAAATEAQGAPPLFREILGKRALWGASLGHFASNYVYYFILSFLPLYLVRSRGFSMEQMTLIATLAYSLNALTALLTGWLTDRWIRRGVSPTLIYKTIMGVTHVVGIGCMAGMLLLPETGCVVSLLVFCLISGCSYPGIFAIPQIIAGPEAAGRWVGVQNSAGNVAGLVAPALTGYLVGSTGLFDLAFGIAALVNILGFVGWVILLPRVAPMRWQTAQAAWDRDAGNPRR